MIARQRGRRSPGLAKRQTRDPSGHTLSGSCKRSSTESAAARFGRQDGSAAYLEDLTDRELSLLRELSGPGTQRDIGAALFLSINTVKGYTKSLYRKLGVSSRQDAVEVGRSLGLI